MEVKNLKSYFETVAKELDGNYTDFSDDTVIITLPVGDGRFHSVKGIIDEKKHGHMVVFTASVCRLHEHPTIDYKKMLEHNYDYGYAKITITDEDFLEVMAAIKYDLCSAEEMKFMIEEISHVADMLEKEITGLDKF
ncbi:MAG: hypothetical protein EAZ85_13670 [Bacteroidetes bacterium]|nr:MAG: hypothetical protein EAZ85_13670 [Bacteroidota bacterium]TAG85951.1 MAG: hypothetical protein EAZ20_13835 [Bacteroidota bacterium]